MGYQESKIQQACVHWFRHLPGIDHRLLVSIPNEGIRTPRNASRMKAEGLNPGVSDLVLFHPRATKPPVFLECKTVTGRQSKTQKDFEAAVMDAGYTYWIFRSVDDFMTIVCDYLNIKQP